MIQSVSETICVMLHDAPRFVTTLDDALEEVRGLTTSGTEIFWLSREGVYGQIKTTSTKAGTESFSSALYFLGSLFLFLCVFWVFFVETSRNMLKLLFSKSE